MNTLKEREDAIVRGIMSGRNACGALDKAVADGNDAYFREAVRPTLEVYEAEAAARRVEYANLSQEAERLRQALEYVASNARCSAQAHIEAYTLRALGRN